MTGHALEVKFDLESPRPGTPQVTAQISVALLELIRIQLIDINRAASVIFGVWL